MDSIVLDTSTLDRDETLAAALEAIRERAPGCCRERHVRGPAPASPASP